MCLEILKPKPDFFFPPVAASYETLRKLARGLKNSEGDFFIVLLPGMLPPPLPSLSGDHHTLEELCFS